MVVAPIKLEKQFGHVVTDTGLNRDHNDAKNISDWPDYVSPGYVDAGASVDTQAVSDGGTRPRLEPRVNSRSKERP